MRDLTEVEALEEARALLARPEAWTRLAFARNEDGYAVPPNAPEATCWCAVGALGKVLDVNPDEESLDIEEAMEQAADKFREDGAYAMSDHSHDKALALLDAALELARDREEDRRQAERAWAPWGG